MFDTTAPAAPGFAGYQREADQRWPTDVAKAIKEIKKSNQRGLKLAQWAALLGYVEIVSGVIVLTAILAITF